MNIPAARAANDKIWTLTGGQMPTPLTLEESKKVRAQCIAIKKALAPDPVPAPPPPPPVGTVKGAMVVNAVNCSADLVYQAGITHVSVELNGPNMADFLTQKWQAFVRGWFIVSRGNDGDSVALALEEFDEFVSFAVIDTESHKADMGGQLAWTEALYAAVRSKVGPAFPLYNVTFGIHSSPQVVNHEAFRRHNVTPIWEAYDSNGSTLGAQATAAKAISEGWKPPHIAIGDKNIPQDAAELKTSPLTYGGVWVWAPEQAGADVLALKGVLG